MKKSILMAAVISVLLSGCAPWRLFGRRHVESSVGNNPLAMAEGKSFYMLKLGFTCKGPMPDAAPIASWLDKVEVMDGQIIRWGTRCNGEGLPLAPEELAMVRLSTDGRTLTIGDKIYALSEKPEK